MRLSRLELENFQSHEHTVLDLSDGINVIVGPSDHGKSAIVRALKWLFIGEPNGDVVCRFGTNETRVTATFEDGTVLIRERVKPGKSPAKNRYRMTRPGEEELVFEGFGNTPPKEITQLHGIRRIKLDTDNRVVVAIADQMAGPFMLDSPGPLKAKAIGRLASVHVVDTAIQTISKDILDGTKEQNRLKDELAQTEVRLAEFSGLPQRKKKLARAKELMSEVEVGCRKHDDLVALADTQDRVIASLAEVEQELQKLATVEAAARLAKEAAEDVDRLAQIRRLFANHKQITEGLAHEESVLERLAGIPAADSLMGEVQSLSAKLERLNGVYSELSAVDNSLEQAEIYLKKLSVIPELEQRLRGVNEGLQRQSQLVLLKERVVALSDQIEALDREIFEAEAFCKKVEDELSEVLKEQKVCPLCGGELGEDAFARLAHRH